jgi:hypothetical protein
MPRSCRRSWSPGAPGTLLPVDAVALASVITSGVVGLTGATAAFYSTHRAAKTAREGRMEQRAADGYLKILSLAEQEAQWLDSIVYNFSLDRKELEYGIVSFLQIAKPALTDRATAAALVSAFGSSAVHTRHTAWREAADAFDTKLEGISFQMTEDGDPTANVPDEWMDELRGFQTKERVARKALAEVVAHELGHRVAQRQRRPSEPLGRVRSRGGRSARARHGASPQGD